jgi:succinylglutamate desuccinylase
MHSEIIGEGRPTLTVVTCLHGDETGGRDAARAVLDDHPGDPAVQLIVANEKAIEAAERSIETDLNRAFPGDRGAGTHEGRLAAELLETVDAPVIDLHTTPSTDDAFCVVAGIDETTARFCRATGLERIVDIGYESGGLIQHVPGISIECGRRGSQEAIENGRQILQNVIAAITSGNGPPVTDPEVYHITGEIERKSAMRFLGKDFQRVEQGEVFATADGDNVVAEEAFYPVLTSSEGYEDRLGYTAERAGTLSEYKTLREQGEDHA